MKRNLFLASVIVLLAAAACKKEPAQPAAPDRSEHIYTFETSAASKTTLGENCVGWEAEDCIGTFAKGQQNEKAHVNVGTPCTFQVKTIGKLEAGDKIYAYAPYAEAAGTEASKVVVSIPAEQSTEHFAMPLAAVPFVVKGELAAGSETPVGGMDFCNLASAAVLRIFSDGTVAAGEKIQSVTISSESDICGSYSIDLTAIDLQKEETLALTQTTGAKAVTVNLATAADVAVESGALEIPVVLAPGTYAVKVVVKTDKTSYFKTSAETVEFIRNHRKPLSLNLAEAEHYGIEKVEPAELRSFKKGEALEYSLTFTGECDVTASCPEGWAATVEGTKLTVTAPADDTKALEGNVVLSVGGAATEVPVRLAGINSQEDLVAFTKSVDNMQQDGYKIDPMYLVDEELSINADITIPSESMAYGAYWLKRLQTPINGNGHTLTFNTTHGSRGGLVQNLGADVHDLNLAGTISAKDANAYVGSLAYLLSKTGLTVSNVTSTVEITISNTGCRAGGLIGAGDTSFLPDGVTLMDDFNMKNCHFNGKIIVNNNAYAVGGILGSAEGKLKSSEFTGCQFNGNITVSGNAQNVGGLLGNAGNKGLHATFNNCKCGSEATITCKEGASKFIGGLVGTSGNCTNPGEIMTMNDCSFEGTIDYSHKSDVGVDGEIRIGGFIGSLDRGAEFSKCSFTGKINVDWANKGSLDGGERGVGGFVGRDTAPNASFPNMNAKSTFAGCVSQGNIIITNSIDSKKEEIVQRLGHLIGRLKNTTDSHKVTDCTLASTITVNGTKLTIEK